MFYRKSKRCQASRQTFLQVERLECREMPAGNVTTLLINGSLTLTGDALDNDVILSQPGIGMLTITPGGGTTINRQANAVTLSGVTHDLNIRLGKGTDAVSFALTAAPITLLGNLTIDYASFGGTGQKSVDTLQDTASRFNHLTVAGNITILYAAGNVSTGF